MFKCYQYKGLGATPIFGVVFMYFIRENIITLLDLLHSTTTYIFKNLVEKNNLAHLLTNLQFVLLLFFFPLLKVHFYLWYHFLYQECLLVFI